MASATALLIAFRAYPRQKEEDRKLQIGLEQRRAYETLVKQFTETKLAFVDMKFEDLASLRGHLSETIKARRKLQVQINAATVLMHAEILPFVRECYQSTSDILKKIAEELVSIAQEAGPGGKIEKKDLSDRCKLVVDDAVVEFDKAIEKLVNEIRVRAYSLDMLKLE
ncbi:hypothetical protein [Ruegeria sp. HKCCA0235A]|uniref:Uncharacterized protein n=2 Tax=Ruegeria atlantica TaxID=81569 RepID=A0ABX1WBJ9_9RHOB|nr:hypothetical protein [Ruegeria sp. HKCCA0235A]NOD30685.1 hypothetical protein [Ruegeria atlantica]